MDEFMQASQWTRTSDGAIRAPMGGIVVEVANVGGGHYQTIIDPQGVSRVSRHDDTSRPANSLEQAMRNAWMFFEPILRGATSYEDLPGQMD